MVLPPLTFIMDSTMNVSEGSIILRIPRVPKNYSNIPRVPKNYSNKRTLSWRVENSTQLSKIKSPRFLFQISSIEFWQF